MSEVGDSEEVDEEEEKDTVNEDYLKKLEKNRELLKVEDLAI